MQAILLKRRIERELARSSVGWSADGLWAERFHLSRLQTQVETLELDPPLAASTAKLGPSQVPNGSRCHDGAALADDVLAWLAPLEQCRGELADEAVRSVERARAA